VHVERALLVRERERVERQRDRGVALLRRRGQRRGELRVIEGRLLLLRVDVVDDEFGAAPHGAAVPQAVRLADPAGVGRDVDREAVVRRAQSVGAGIVGRRALPGGGGGNQQRGGERQQ